MHSGALKPTAARRLVIKTSKINPPPDDRAGEEEVVMWLRLNLPHVSAKLNI